MPIKTVEIFFKIYNLMPVKTQSKDNSVYVEKYSQITSARSKVEVYDICFEHERNHYVKTSKKVTDARINP